MPTPRIPLSDGAGEVLENGPGASRFQTGDPVLANFMTGWVSGGIDTEKARTALGGDIDGVLAEEVVLPESALLPVPKHLSLEEAATLPCAAVTAWHALMVDPVLKAGETVLIQGTGGVSIFALQIARMAGARVIATSSQDAKLARLATLGADQGINYKTEPRWADRVLELTDGRGVDHIVEVGGAGTLPSSLRSVRLGGHIALIGVLSGVGAEFNPMPVLMKSVRLQGIFVGSREMFEAMNRAFELHQVKPVIDRSFSFEQAVEALNYMESGAHFGKIVVRI
jgi:NADPH:quinone reductase-like Zn-dependent oxidoreductase